MKIFPAVSLFLILLFSAYTVSAQDTAVQRIADSAVHVLPVPKKTVKKKNPVRTDSAAGISAAQDTSIHKSGLKKPSRKKQILTDSTGKKLLVVRDSVGSAPAPPGKPVRHKQLVIDSSGNYTIVDADSLIQDIPVPKKSLKHKRVLKDSVVILSDSARAVQDSLRLIARKLRRDSLHIQDSIQVIARKLRKDSLHIQDSLNVIARKMRKASQHIDDSLRRISDRAFADSVNKHWTGWKKFQVLPAGNYSLFSKRVLKGKTKAELQYNIADFYLYLNGQPVMPPISGYGFFAAGCLCFKYDDTLLLNSGLGSKVGVGVGIKIIDGRFTGSLHANNRNAEIYKLFREDSVYGKTVMAVPVTESLKLKSRPVYSANEVVIGEYRATYRTFYQKNADDEDEPRQYTVRIIFRCRVTGGIDSMKSLSVTNPDK